MKVFIIHGSFGNPQENWFPWLRKELEMLHCDVYVPQMPSVPEQNLENWITTFAEYLPLIDENTIFVGHSLAPAFILSVLEKLHQPVKACFFVSGFLDLLGNEMFDEVNKTFVQKEFDWGKIKNNSLSFTVYHSDTDPYVPVSCAEKLASYLSIDVALVPNAGHFNTEAGYTTFPLLLDEIKKLL